LVIKNFDFDAPSAEAFRLAASCDERCRSGAMDGEFTVMENPLEMIWGTPIFGNLHIIYIYIYYVKLPAAAARTLQPTGTSLYTLSYGFFRVSLGLMKGFFPRVFLGFLSGFCKKC